MLEISKLARRFLDLSDENCQSTDSERSWQRGLTVSNKTIDLFTDTAAKLNLLDLRSIMGRPGGTSTICYTRSGYTAISRKVVAKTVYATIPKGNMGYDQYSCSWHCSCRTYFCCFPLALANILPWPLVPFFEISLKNSELKTTHNTFRDCRVHFFRQPFSKQL